MCELSKDQERLLFFLDAEYDRRNENDVKFARITKILGMDSRELHSSARFLCGQEFLCYVTDSLRITPKGRKCVRELRASARRQFWGAVETVVKFVVLPALAIVLGWLIIVLLK